MKKILIMMSFVAATLQAQNAYTGRHKFDGEHKNELSGYLMGGTNVVSGTFGGFEASYKRHLTDRWHVGADAQMQFGKQLYSIDVQGGYRLPIGWSDFYIDGKAMFNRYNRWSTNEVVGNLSITWEMPYFYVRIGESLIHFQTENFGYTEPLTFTFGIGAQIRPRWNSWNLGIFFRNYDDFYYENWNINWGLNFYATLTKDMQLFGEFNVRPAGSISQLASKYETSGKLGLKYVW
ncbi:MAG: hypothetical protein IJ605_02685 [Prevotella sp.]|nr:hypothetical protein [Prevotella sp.]